MRRSMMTVAAAAAFGAMLATAQAEILTGGPTQNGNQGFKYWPGNDEDGRFGTWAVSPQTVSASKPTPAPPRAQVRHRRAEPH